MSALPPDDRRWVTGVELAAILGVTKSSVSAATRNGRIARDSETGLYDREVCVGRWGTTRQEPQGRGVMGRPREQRSDEQMDLERREREAKLRKAEADAELAELKAREQAGDLVRRDRAERLLFDALRLVRDKIRVIPDDAPALAVESDEHAIRTRLQTRIDDALESVSADVLSLPDEQDDDAWDA